MPLLAPPILLSKEALAEPETWFEPSVSLVGSGVGARFGSSLACSYPSINTGNTSFIAVGAPDENGGAGAAYIYNPDAPNSYLQKLTSEFAGVGRAFGTALTFIKDFNGDEIDELAVTEPASGGSDSIIWVYQSTNSSPPYVRCASKVLLGAGWGKRLIGAQRHNNEVAATLIISEPNDAGYDAFYVVLPFTGSSECNVNLWSNMSSLPLARRYTAIAELPQPPTADIQVIIGAPSQGSGSNAGEVYTDELWGAPSTLFRSGGAAENLGASVAAIPLNGVVAFSASGSQKILVTSLEKNVEPDPNICSINASVPSLPSSNATYLAHLDSAFTPFLGGTASFAAAQSQASTGGSVALFSADLINGCSALKQFNNCIFDATQEQAYALTGGSDCRGDYHGTKSPMLLVGAPGYNASQGRVDIIFQGSEFAVARPCNVTATPTPTATAAPPSKPTPNPVPFPDIVTVSPGRGGLPAPIISPGTTGGSVIITMPEVKLRSSAASILAQRLGVNSKTLNRLLLGKAIQYTYVIEIEQQLQKARHIGAKDEQPESFKKSEAKDSTSSSQSWRKVRTARTRNRISLQRLSPGRSYRATYQVQISIKGSSRTASTKASEASNFNT